LYIIDISTGTNCTTLVGGFIFYLFLVFVFIGV